MFLGAELHSRAHAYMRGRNTKEGRTHWKVIAIRHRYSDQPHISVDIHFLKAKQVRGEWIGVGDTLVYHKVRLADYPNFSAERRLLKTEDPRGDEPILDTPRIVAELQVIVDKIVEEFDGRPIETSELDALVREICLKKSVDTQRVA